MSKKKPRPWVPVSDDMENGVKGNAKELAHLLPKVSWHSTYSSPETFANHIEKQDRSRAWHDSAWDSGEFYGSKSMEETLSFAREGWKQGVDKVEDVRRRIAAKYPLRKEPIKYGIAGSFPSVPRAVAGNILNMRQIDMSKTRKKKVLTLICDMAACCGVDQAALSNRAAVLAVLIDQIESQGYSCEVIATAPTKYGDFTAITSVIAKQSHQPVDISRLAFALGHASMFRRLVFADWGTDDRCRKLGVGLGHNYKIKASKELEEKGIYVVPSANRGSEYFESEERAAVDGVKYLIYSLVAQGCPVFEAVPPKTEEEKKMLETAKVSLGLEKDKNRPDWWPDEF